MEAPVETWCERGSRTVLTKDMNESGNGRDGDDAEMGEGMSGLECVTTGTGLAVWLWSSLAAHLREMQLRVRSTMSSRRTKSKN